MTVERTDRDAYEMVMRKGLQPRTVGAGQGYGMKERPAAMESAGPQVAADGWGVAAKEGFGGVEMAIIGGRVIRERPRLIVIDGGRK